MPPSESKSGGEAATGATSSDSRSFLRRRVIPALLLRRNGLYKTTRFSEPTYIGDPINAVRIFNEKEVDELIFLDIEATVAGRGIEYVTLKSIATECFMPLCYGGGVAELSDVERVLETGVEKVSVNSLMFSAPHTVEAAAREFGSSTMVASVDYKRDILGRMQVMTASGTKKVGAAVVKVAKLAENLGVGEILLNSIDRDGTMKGYDLPTIKTVSEAVDVPVVAMGGAGSLEDLASAVGSAGAAAAGSFFVFHGKHRAVLITYPTQDELIASVFPRS